MWLQWKENRKKADFYTVSSLFFSSKPSCQAAATHPVRKYSLYFRLNWLTHSLSLSHASRLSANPPRRCSNNNLSKMFGNWLWIAALLRNPHAWRRDGAPTVPPSPPGSHPSWSLTHPEQSHHLKHTHLITFNRNNLFSRTFHLIHFKQLLMEFLPDSSDSWLMLAPPQGQEYES